MPQQKRTCATGRETLSRAGREALAGLSPRAQRNHPALLLGLLSALLATALFLLSLLGLWGAGTGIFLALAVVLWLTCLLSAFATALAEGRGRAQGAALRASKRDVEAHKLEDPSRRERFTAIASSLLKRGDVVVVRAGEQIPADGEVLSGAASVDESAITGESAPVIRESGGDRSAVTGGTTLLSDWLVIAVTSEAGTGFLDQMIAMVEGTSRGATAAERTLERGQAALSLGLALMTAVLCACALLFGRPAGAGIAAIPALLLLLLAPTALGALLSTVGIAGMGRLNRANVLSKGGGALEAAGKVDVLLLDKAGTITLGSRQAAAFIPVDGCTPKDLADAAQLASLADETPEGRSIVVLAKEEFGLRGRAVGESGMHFIPFTAATRMSGADFAGHEVRKGAADAVRQYIRPAGGRYSDACAMAVEKISRQGGTPLVVTRDHKILGVIHLKDIVKQGVRETFDDLRSMGIQTTMITGDNPITAAAIAAEAGVDDFLAEATPEGRLRIIRSNQAKGHRVAMAGGGAGDAPALAQADVAVSMNSGTQAAKEAGNMVDLDSSPTKLIDIVHIGRQLLTTRGRIAAFSVANDLARCAVLLPAVFAALYPGLSPLNAMHFSSPQGAVLSAAVYNILVIAALIPLALRGVRHPAASVGKKSVRGPLVCGLGGIAAPFIFIKLIDMVLAALVC